MQQEDLLRLEGPRRCHSWVAGFHHRLQHHHEWEGEVKIRELQRDRGRGRDNNRRQIERHLQPDEKLEDGRLGGQRRSRHPQGHAE